MVRVPAPATAGTVRLAEIVGALSLATDLGTGMPLDHGIRSCLVALRLGERAGLDTDTLADLYYLSLLRMLGCTSDAHEMAEFFGDEIRFGTDTQMLDYGDPRSVGAWVMASFGSDQPEATRQRMLERIFTYTPEMRRSLVGGHCEVAQLLAGRLGVGARVRESLGHVFERWDGNGAPAGRRGGEIPLIARIANLSKEIETHYRLYGVDGAVRMVEQRAGGAWDPELCGWFTAEPRAYVAVLDLPSAWDAALDAEPGPRPELTPDALDAAARAVAEYTDLKSTFTFGHSPAVARLAEAAAQRLGLGAEDAAIARRAGLMEDLGRTTISAAIWDKPGRLSDDEWERVRLHSYHTERILGRAPGLRAIAVAAGLHHERLDGSGYHRGARGPALPAVARVLAAADAYQAMTETRPHRPASSADEAAAALQGEARAGRLDPDAVQAVLDAAANRVVARRAHHPAGLTARELEVLRLVARGLSTRQIADTLVISPKTVDTHIQHLYGKIAVSTRAGATMFAMQHDLLA